jgi:hypothetical protein
LVATIARSNRTAKEAAIDAARRTSAVVIVNAEPRDVAIARRRLLAASRCRATLAQHSTRMSADGRRLTCFKEVLTNRLAARMRQTAERRTIDCAPQSGPGYTIDRSTVDIATPPSKD